MTTPDDTQLLDLIPPEAEIVRRIIEEVRQYPRIRRPLLRFLAADDFDELLAAIRGELRQHQTDPGSNGGGRDPHRRDGRSSYVGR